jgi:hypothetical protein
VDACHKSLVQPLISGTGSCTAVSKVFAAKGETVNSVTVPFSVKLALTAVFSSLIAVGTILSIPLPAPLYELTWSPAIYLALSALTDKWTAFSSTAIGGFVGEAFNVAYKGGGSPIYPFGMIWARAPEVLIVAWGASRGGKMFKWGKLPRAPYWLVFSMILATVYETMAFFVSDGLFYAYGLFQYGSPEGLVAGFGVASADFFTMVDLVYIPVALAIIIAARPAFRRLGFTLNVKKPADPGAN